MTLLVVLKSGFLIIVLFINSNSLPFFLITTGRFRFVSMSFNTASISGLLEIPIPLFFFIFLNNLCNSAIFISGLFLGSFNLSTKCLVNSTSILNFLSNLSANFSNPSTSDCVNLSRKLFFCSCFISASDALFIDFIWSSWSFFNDDFLSGDAFALVSASILAFCVCLTCLILFAVCIFAVAILIVFASSSSSLSSFSDLSLTFATYFSIYPESLISTGTPTYSRFFL